MSVAETLALDARSLHVGFEATLGPLRVRGAFGEVRGELHIPDDDIERASLRVQVRSDSLDTGLAMRDRHLRGPSFLDTGRHPVVTFESTRIARSHDGLLVTGRLTLRGIARDVVVRCAVARPDTHAAAGIVSISGTIEVPLHEHRIATAQGVDRLNPIFLLIGDRVAISVRLSVPADRILPALYPRAQPGPKTAPQLAPEPTSQPTAGP